MPSKPALPAISPLHRPDVLALRLYLVCAIIDTQAAGRAGANPRLIVLGLTELYATLLGVVCRHEQSTASGHGSANGKPYARDEGRGRGP
jgi:hypothetical protein